MLRAMRMNWRVAGDLGVGDGDPVFGQLARAETAEWLGPNGTASGAKPGIVEKSRAGGPPVKWRTPVGAGLQRPAVASGRVYSDGPPTATNANNPADPFSGIIQGHRRVLCLDEVHGNILWKHEYGLSLRGDYAAGPRTTPLSAAARFIRSARKQFCSAGCEDRGGCCRTNSKRNNIETPMWDFRSNPLLRRPAVICLAGGSNTTAAPPPRFDKGHWQRNLHAFTAQEAGYGRLTGAGGGNRSSSSGHPESVNSLIRTGAVLLDAAHGSQGRHVLPPRVQIGDRLYFTCLFTAGSRCCTGQGQTRFQDCLAEPRSQ